MYNPLFSLISVCHDRWMHLSQTWISWINQTYPRIEIVVVCSGSDRSPVSLLNNGQYKGCVVRIENSEYVRPSCWRNIGARYAQGDYFGFVDADVNLHNNWVSFCMQRLTTSHELIINHRLYSGLDGGPSSGTVAVCRWLFEKVNGYNENLDDAWGYEDTDLITRLQRAEGRVAPYPADYAKAIQHDDNLRIKHYARKDPARSPKIFLKHIQTCKDDSSLHPFKANIESRLKFSPIDIVEFRKR